MEEIIDQLRSLALRLNENNEREAIELDDIADSLENLFYDSEEESILDIDKFKRELQNQNLMTKSLEDFIENYMRFDNKR